MYFQAPSPTSNHFLAFHTRGNSPWVCAYENKPESHQSDAERSQTLPLTAPEGTECPSAHLPHLLPAPSIKEAFSIKGGGSGETKPDTPDTPAHSFSPQAKRREKEREPRS